MAVFRYNETQCGATEMTPCKAELTAENFEFDCRVLKR
jgi:hypothetical protein